MFKLIQNKYGLSLLETTIVLGIFSMLIVVWMSLFINGIKLFPFVFKQSESVNAAEHGVNMMVKEIRNASMGDDGHYVLEMASDNALIFYSDIDLDGQVERVRYLIENEEFKKGVIKSYGNPAKYLAENETIRTVAKNVKNNSTPTFYYYDGNNNVLQTEAILTKTKMIKVRLELGMEGRENYILESYTQIRNLKTNL
ncbi:MAG: hypothetical protein V1649_04585 [Patescibacteria group bacterium]